MFKLSAITDEVSQDLEVASKFAESFNLNGVEIRNVWGKPPHDLLKELDKVKRILKRYKLEVSAVASPFFKADLNDPEEYERHIEILKKSIELAKEVETNIIRGFAFWRNGTLDEHIDEIVEKFQRPLEIVEKEGVILAIENEPSTFIGNGQELAQFLNRIGSKNIGAVWDPGNDIWDPSGETPYPDGYSYVRGKTVHVHIKDGVRKGTGGKHQFVAFGEGEVDYVGQLKALKKDGYSGYLSLETHWILKKRLPSDAVIRPEGEESSTLQEESSRICMKNLQEPARTTVADLLFTDLGTSIYRLRAWTKIESANDDDDPNHFNWAAFNFNTDEDQVWNAIQAKNRGVTKFIASVWSPPGWMKNTGSETNGGYLLPSMYQEFAEWLAAYVIGYKTHHGIDIGWIGIQNEPDYVASWETCTYTPEQLRDVIKVVGAKFSAEKISAKIVIPETSGSSEVPGFVSTIMSDPEAARYVEVFANHLYDTSFFSPDERISFLQGVARYGTQYNKPIWQTEYSYLETTEAGTFREALFTAHHIHNVLTFENGSAYLVWELFWYRETGLISISQDGSNYTVTPKFYAAKQFFKFISPGSKRIEAVVNNPNILASAYMNETDGNVTIVVINKGQNSIATIFDLRNVATASFKQYRTSTSENCKYVGDIAVSNNSFDTNLPPESITTFTAA